MHAEVYKQISDCTCCADIQCCDCESTSVVFGEFYWMRMICHSLLGEVDVTDSI